MQDIYSRHGVDADAAQLRMKKLMAEEGLPYGNRTHTYNSRLAQELGAWVATLEGFDDFHDAVFRAYFVDARNISDENVLIDVANSVGLPEAETRKVLSERLFKDAVDADWAKSHEYGVTGVPTYISQGYGVVGAQSFENLAQFLDKIGASRN